ncbi:hypothetical protein INR49_030348, partial [Caranx melampygus]
MFNSLPPLPTGQFDERATMVLNPVISKLSGKLVVLASASPRRLEILRNAGLRFEVVPSWFKETLDKRLFKAPQEYAVETAKQKALEVARRMPFKHLKTPDIVIGADTIVTVDGMILEKPVDKQDAYRMLSSLSGKEHSVYTGVAIVLCHEKESEDKAGGYGIQALGGMLVEYVHGDFLNVVGFPLNHFCKQLNIIYNSDASCSDQESASVHVSCNGTHTTSVATSPPPNLPAQSSHSPSSSTKHNSSPSRRPNSPPGGQAHSTNDSPPFSPVHKVKRKGSESELGESSWMLVNSLSKHTENREAEIRVSENATLPVPNSRGQAMELNVTEQEDSEPKKEDLQRITELMDGFKASKALFTASKLCVFDLLQSRPGLDAAQVAQDIKASVKGTECLLEACVSLGLLKSKERTGQKPLYENTDLAVRFLRTDAPLSLHGYIQHCNNTIWPLFSHLESAVREGTHQHEKAFGKKSKDVFQDAYYNSQEVKLRFMKAMHSIAKVTGKAVATAFDLSSYKVACDLGGCTGAMAYEFTKAHPGLSVTVFDLPAVVEMSEHFHPLHKDNRVSFVAGDFFEDELPKADLYILARILHDWPDEKVHVLLGKIANACTPGCGLLLSEIFLDEDRRGPSRGLLQALSMRCAVLIAETMLDGQTTYSALQSLNMLAQTEGQERTESKYADMLSKHGFGNTRVVHTKNFLDAFIAIKLLLTPPRGATEEERNSTGFKDFSGFLLTLPSALPSPALHVDLFLVIPCQTIFLALGDWACMCTGIRTHGCVEVLRSPVQDKFQWQFDMILRLIFKRQSLKSSSRSLGMVWGEPCPDVRQHLRADLRPGVTIGCDLTCSAMLSSLRVYLQQQQQAIRSSTLVIEGDIQTNVALLNQR